MANGNNDVQNGPRIELNPEMKQVYMTGAFGGFTPHDFRIIIFNEKPTMEDKKSGNVDLIRDANHEIIMSHLTAKELYDWLGKAIDEFEGKVGKITNTYVDLTKK